MRLTILFILCNLSLFGQEKTISDLENEAFLMYEEGNKIEAIEKFKELYLKYPNTDNAPLTIYNVAITYQEIDSIPLAKEWYEKILSSTIKDNQEHYNFPDTHTNIKHKSAANLGNIYYNEKDNQKALVYYKKALYEYPYYSTSGTSTKKDEIKTKKWIADCYDNLNQPNEVIKILLPEAITASPWENNPIAEFLADYIIKNGNKDLFIRDFDKAIKSIKRFEDYDEINLFNESIKIYPYHIDNHINYDSVKKGEFYKYLTSK